MKRNLPFFMKGSILRKKVAQQLIWKKTRTISIDSQEVTPRVTKPIEKILFVNVIVLL